MLKHIRILTSHMNDTRKYFRLLILRSPIDAMLTVMRSGLLFGAFYAIARNDTRILLMVCIGSFVVSCLIYSYNGMVWRAFGSEYVHICGRLKGLLFDKILKMPLQSLEKRSSGDVMTRMNQDYKMAGNILGEVNNLPHMLLALFDIVVSSILLAMIDYKMLLLTLVFVIPHILVQYFWVSGPITRRQRNVQTKVGDCIKYMASMISMSDVVTLYDAGDMLARNFEQSSKAIYKERMGMVLQNTLTSIFIPLFGLAGYIALMLNGLTMISNEQMGFAALIAVFQLRGGVLLSGLRIIYCISNMRMNMAGVIRTNEMLAKEVE